ncbi:unnamed protein product [Ectocarpus sp. 6 AP-2014]
MQGQVGHHVPRGTGHTNSSQGRFPVRVVTTVGQNYVFFLHGAQPTESNTTREQVTDGHYCIVLCTPAPCFNIETKRVCEVREERHALPFTRHALFLPTESTPEYKSTHRDTFLSNQALAGERKTTPHSPACVLKECNSCATDLGHFDPPPPTPTPRSYGTP